MSRTEATIKVSLVISPILVFLIGLGVGTWAQLARDKDVNSIRNWAKNLIASIILAFMTVLMIPQVMELSTEALIFATIVASAGGSTLLQQVVEDYKGRLPIFGSD